jgi:hypothetical protein
MKMAACGNPGYVASLYQRRTHRTARPSWRNPTRITDLTKSRQLFRQLITLVEPASRSGTQLAYSYRKPGAPPRVGSPGAEFGQKFPLWSGNMSTGSHKRSNPVRDVRLEGSIEPIGRLTAMTNFRHCTPR